jgi:hypothetical protein
MAEKKFGEEKIYGAVKSSNPSSDTSAMAFNSISIILP